MTSPQHIHETIARMRRRVREINTLICGIEQGRIPVDVVAIKRSSAPRPVRILKPMLLREN